jgi:hypothetical protein
MSNRFVYPRPEYPRPDRQRGTLEGVDWINLNGPWQFRFDGHRRGEDERWFNPDQPDWREQIIVPFCWESLAAWGEGDAAGNDNYYATRVFKNPLEVNRSNHRGAERYEVGWYRKHVEIPANDAWNNKRIILTIGAADFFTDGWCNGVHLGHHEGGYIPFEFDLTDSLKTLDDGRRVGVVVLRVEDPMNNNEQPVGKQWRWYTTTSGIWQTVYVEPRAASHIDCFRIITDIDASTAHFEIETLGDIASAAIDLEINAPTGEIQTATIPLRNRKAEKTISISPLHLWNPNEPNLYTVRLRLKDGQNTVDSVRSYFGMRKIGGLKTDDPSAPEALSLNNVPRYLRGALHQSYYPEGVYTAADVQTFKNDIAYAKKVGFNFLRIHIKIDDPLLLYYADKMGILIMADFPNFGEGGDTPLGRKRFEEMMRAAIKRDFNHPCIFAWCLFNETWGFGGQVEFVKVYTHFPRPPGETLAQPDGPSPASALSGVNPEVAEVTTADAEKPKDAAEAAVARVKIPNQTSHAWVQQMWEVAKKLDATRLIEDMSVVHWEHLDYYAHGDTDINSWHFYIHDYYKAKEHIEKVVGATYPGSTFNYVDGYKQKSQPLINSEYGGIGALDGDRDVSWSFKFLTNELRRHGKISGYIYTELHDVEWEFNGFLNYDRTPKEFGYDPAIINESDTLPVDFPPIVRCRPGDLLKVPVASSHYSTKKRDNVSLQWKLSGIDSAARIHEDLGRGSAAISFPHRRVAPAHTVEFRAPDKNMVCTLFLSACQGEDGQCLAKNFVQIFVSSGYPPNREEGDRSLILRGSPADWSRAEWSNYSGNRDEERALDCCFGFGHGFFEWNLPLEGADINKAVRLKVLCEASSRRIDTPQTDDDKFPTTLQLLLNGFPVYEATIPNHPHDTRGALSYLRGGKGAYGYLVYAIAEGDMLRRIAGASRDSLVLRCAVPKEAMAQNGLSIYGAECGRYPISPTVVIEW